MTEARLIGLAGRNQTWPLNAPARNIAICILTALCRDAVLRSEALRRPG